MSIDQFDQLAHEEVPAPPQEFDQGVHHRVNRILLVGHLTGFALQVAPYVAWHLSKAAYGWLHLTVTGSYGKQKRRD